MAFWQYIEPNEANLTYHCSAARDVSGFVSNVPFPMQLGRNSRVKELNVDSNCARSLVLWFKHCGMTEMLPHAWDTQGGFKGSPSSQTSALH